MYGMQDACYKNVWNVDWQWKLYCPPTKFECISSLKLEIVHGLTTVNAQFSPKPKYPAAKFKCISSLKLEIVVLPL